MVMAGRRKPLEASLFSQESRLTQGNIMLCMPSTVILLRIKVNAWRRLPAALQPETLASTLAILNVFGSLKP